MSRRWLVLWGILVLVLLSGCELATPPPLLQQTPSPKAAATPSSVPLAATAVPWPAGPLVFPHLGAIWMVEGASPYPLTAGHSPVLSPDGRRVAYLLPLTETSDLNQVYVLDLPSAQILLVSGEPALYDPPAWSPDGRYLAYTVGSILVVTDPRGEVQRALASDVGAVGQGPVVPAWSANGQTIVCPLARVGESELFAINVDDGQATRLSYTGGFPASAPFVVLSDDTRVAARDTVLFANMSDGGSLWAVHLDGSGRQRIVPELEHIAGLMILSPDGGRLAGLRQLPGERDYALWVLDLTVNSLQWGETLAVLPDVFQWAADGRTAYWVLRGALHRYAVAGGRSEEIAALPPPSPTPTATPLPVAERLIYYSNGSFYEAEAYAEGRELKAISPSIAVVSGYSLRRGVVVFSRGADIYALQLRGGVPTRFYSFQQAGLVRIEVIWSLQGNALLYSAVYEEKDAAFGRRVDIGVIRLAPSTREIIDMRRFTSVVDRTGVTPVLFDEERGQAVLVPFSGDVTFNRLEVYDVQSGVEVGFLGVEGKGAAAVSADWRWAAVTDYDQESRRGLIRFYDLASAETLSSTFYLPEGTFTWGPLRWSPDGQYLALIPLQGKPEGGEQRSLGIWVVRPETLEATMVVPLEDPEVLLVGWSSD